MACGLFGQHHPMLRVSMLSPSQRVRRRGNPKTSPPNYFGQKMKCVSCTIRSLGRMIRPRLWLLRKGESRLVRLLEWLRCNRLLVVPKAAAKSNCSRYDDGANYQDAHVNPLSCLANCQYSGCSTRAM